MRKTNTYTILIVYLKYVRIWQDMFDYDYEFEPKLIALWAGVHYLDLIKLINHQIQRYSHHLIPKRFKHALSVLGNEAGSISISIFSKNYFKLCTYNFHIS